VVRRIVGALRPSAGDRPDVGGLPALPIESWPLVLELSEPAVALPLARATRVPELNQRVAVIGFPRDQSSMSSGAFGDHFARTAGEKQVMPGAVVRASEGAATFEYECFTPAGTGGGPVIDLETGTVVGMHVAALPAVDGRTRGVAVSLSPLARDLEKTSAKSDM